VEIPQQRKNYAAHLKILQPTKKPWALIITINNYTRWYWRNSLTLSSRCNRFNPSMKNRLLCTSGLLWSSSALLGRGSWYQWHLWNFGLFCSCIFTETIQTVRIQKVTDLQMCNICSTHHCECAFKI